MPSHPAHHPIDSRPGLAMIANVPTPYRIHLHQRVAREVPEYRLHSLFTHAKSQFNWADALPPEIHPVSFAMGQERTTSSVWRRACTDWIKGGRLIKYLHVHGVKAAIVNGYNSLALMRVLRHCRRHGIATFVWADANIKGDRAKDPIRNWIKRRWVGAVVRWTNGFLPCGTLGRDYFVRYGANPKSCYFVPNEPDYALFEQRNANRIQEFLKRSGLNPNRRRLMFSGRLIPLKRVDMLLEAFMRIAPHRPEWDMLIVGDGPLRPALEQQVPESLRSRVTWAGFLEMSDLPLAYHVSDVLVLTSNFDQWALVINEAAAAGLAIVSSDVVGAAAELVRHGHNGCVFQSENLASLVQALETVTTPGWAQRAGQASLEVLAQWRQVADPIAGVRAALTSAGLLPHHAHDRHASPLADEAGA
jgi:glycosyltransferase involved in cell wall biosynthesis